MWVRQRYLIADTSCWHIMLTHNTDRHNVNAKEGAAEAFLFLFLSYVSWYFQDKNTSQLKQLSLFNCNNICKSSRLLCHTTSKGSVFPRLDHGEVSLESQPRLPGQEEEERGDGSLHQLPQSGSSLQSPQQSWWGSNLPPWCSKCRAQWSRLPRPQKIIQKILSLDIILLLRQLNVSYYKSQHLG